MVAVVAPVDQLYVAGTFEVAVNAPLLGAVQVGFTAFMILGVGFAGAVALGERCYRSNSSRRIFFHKENSVVFLVAVVVFVVVLLQ